MPRYEYRCETNGQTIEVSHPMSHKLNTWGEVCQLAEIETGNTPPNTPVEKVLSLGFVQGGTSNAPSGGGGHTCSRPGCCMGG